MGSEHARPVFVFVDESGNLDFSNKGTRYFLLTAFVTTDPLECGYRLNALSYEFLVRGLDDQIPFHATENSVGTRKRVLGAMCSVHICWVHSVFAEKSRTPSAHRTPHALYANLGRALVLQLVERLGRNYAPIVLMFDSVLTAKQRAAFLKAVKPQLNQLDVPYRISFRPVAHDVNGQIADYFAWSLFRLLERQDPSWFNQLPRPHSESEAS